jgi:dipeptidyl aminopeptidase/acylaminoacyl peptidase
MQSIWKWVRALGALVAGLGLTAGLAAQPAAELFARWPAIDDVRISPSGRRLALLQYSPDGYRRLAVIDLDPPGNPRVVANFSDGDIRRIEWVNDDRLVLEASARGAAVWAGRAGLWAVDHDGGRFRRLVTSERSIRDSAATMTITRMLPGGWALHSVVDDGTSEIVVSRVARDSVGDPTDVQLSRLDTVTGERRGLNDGLPPDAWHWLLDAKGEPRLVSAEKGNVIRIHWRAPGAAAWEQIAQFERYKESNWWPWFVEPDGQVLVTGRLGRDSSALYRLDPVTRQVDAKQPIVAADGFDLRPSPVVDTRTRRLLGAHLSADRPLTHWLDAGFAKLQRSLDAALPERRNRILCGRCETTRFLVVRSQSDRQPSEYYLFDREKQSLQMIGAERPWIDAATQGRRTLHRVAMRDGLAVPVYVTHPPGARDDQPLPTVVLVHGGPWVRGGDLLWRPEAQFLASRGWRVLEPEFRGSDGYGWRLFRAGFKQWGGAMQDDLVDTLQWAGAQKLSDPQRACVMGASYGGYAALMAPIVHPGVFRCAAAFAAVTDIQLMYELNNSDFSQAARTYGMPQLIGDPKADAELLRRSSPLLRAAELKLPVLLAYGGEDVRVPPDHATRFASAAKSAGVPIEVVAYPTEGHGFFEQKNQADWWQRVERFLATHLAAPR